MMKFLFPFLSLSFSVVISFTVSSAGYAVEKGIEHRVEDLQYGQALFDYFQKNDLAAITQLLVAEQRPQSQNQTEESALLLADLFYSYGLYRESNHLFSQLLGEETSQGIKNRVWFNLAKLNYEQGEYAAARELLSNISQTLPAHIESERQYLLANLYLIDRQYQQAKDSNQKIANDSIWRRYSDYNLGVYLIEDNQFEQAKPLLNELGRNETNSTEMKALRDKANLALGFSQLKRSKPESAIDYLSRIRVHGPLSNNALLGAGWAWSRLDNKDKALLPWLTLTQKNKIDPATQEALLAIPTLFEKNKSTRLAVHYYELAAAKFDQQLSTLDQVTLSIKQNELISALQKRNLIKPANGFTTQPPDSVTTPYLHILMASKKFQKALKRFQELRNIQTTLAHWQKNLPTLALMLDERRKNFEQKLPLLEQSADFGKLQQLSQQRAKYTSKLNEVSRAQNYLQLATAEEKQQLDRLSNIASSLKNIDGKKNIDSQSDMYRIMSGILHWQISTDYNPRYWKAKKQLLALDKALDEANQRAHKLHKITQTTRLRFVEFDTRINGQQQKIENLKQRVADLIVKQEAHINQLAIEAIEQQQHHIIQLRLNARYSLARLYDSLVIEQ
jgi:hypothetical protein